MEDIFTGIYERRVWGNNGISEYVGSSGPGSSIDYNIETYVPFLKKFITENKIKKVVDLGCGDFRCGKLIYDDLDISYIGYDAYNKIVEYNSKENLPPKYSFIHLDFFTNKESIVSADMCILKDVLQHWCLNDIYNFLDYLVENKKFKYILICNGYQQDKYGEDIQNGDTRELSCEQFPLKKYNPQKLLNYQAKEVSVINL